MADSFRLVALGQALIERLPGTRERAQLGDIGRIVAGADVAFCNLEVALRTAAPGWPTKERTVHTAPAAVLDVLRDLNITAVSLANNHIGDLGPLNVIETMREVAERGLLHAGAGIDADDAAASRSGGDFALVAVSVGPAPVPGRALNATALLPPRPGVNGLTVTRRPLAGSRDFAGLERFLDATGQSLRAERERRSGRAARSTSAELDVYGTAVSRGESSGECVEADAADVARVVSSVAQSSTAGQPCLLSIHYHDWEPDWSTPPPWLVELAHAAVNAGAFAVIAHGPPVPSGIEIYQDALIAYGTGSLVFHTHRTSGYPQPEVWTSPFIDARFDRSMRLREARVRAIVIDRADSGAPGFPRLATTKEALATIALISRLSEPFGTIIRPLEDGGGLLLSAARH